MKRGTASRVVIGGNTMLDLPKGLVFGTDVILGGIAGLTSDFNGLVLSNTLMLGKKISHISVITVIVRGQSPLNLPYAIADSLHYVNAFGGTELLPKTYLDTVTLSGGCEQRNLPVGYTQLEYIESSGAQYIDTGVYVATGYKVRVKAYATSIPTTTAFFGCTTTADASNAHKGIYRIIGGTINRCAWGDGSGSVVGSLTGNDSLNTWYDMVCDNGVWTINDELFATCTEVSFTSEYSMWLFARNTGGTVGLPASCRISVCQIWDNNGRMIRNLVPAKNASNVVGMYDLVNGVFYQNAGTGDFVAGPTAVPTPDTPMDIVSNNGVLKYGFNYYSYNVTRQLSVANYPVELDRSISYSNGVLTCGITGSVSSNRGLYPSWDMSFTAGHKYACVVMAKGDTRINLGLASIIPSGSVTGGSSSDGFYTLTSNFVWYAKRWECNTDSSARLNIRVAGTDVGQYASFKDILVIDLTAIFGAGNEPTTSSDIIQRTVKIYTDGTVEQVTDSLGNTATAERLLSVGDYKDTQEVLSGAITHNVGIKVLDGTEDWVFSTAWLNYMYSLEVNDLYAEASSVASNRKSPYCTHFGRSENWLGGSQRANMVQAYQPTTGDAILGLGYGTPSTANLATFKQWLADQYSAGTPVIVVYPLKTATTETVTPQVLEKEPITQTAGSISNLDVTAVSSVHTTPTPQKPLQINCNNGVLKYGNVSKNLFNEVYPNVSNSMKYLSIYLGPGQYTCSYSFPHNDNGTSLIYFLNGQATTGAGNNVNQVDASNPRTVNSSTGYVTIAYRNGSDIGRPGALPADYDCMLAQGQTATPYEPYRLAVYADGTQETIRVGTKNLFDEQWNRNTGVSTQTATWGQVVTASGWSTSGLVPVKAGQQYTVSYNTTVQIYVFYYESDGTMQQSYDTTSATKKTFTVPAGATHIRLQVNKSTEAAIADLEAQLETGATATDYEPYYDGGTATAEMLLKAGTYQDVQSILDGAVTRNIGVKVLDGTENWEYRTNVTWQGTTYARLSARQVISNKAAMTTGANKFLCSHGNGYAVQGYTDSTPLGFSLFIASLNNVIYATFPQNTTAEDVKQWLASQYAAGTPVIVVYPLAESTTESVTGQTLQVQEGNNILEITQASMNDLELEASYDTGVVAIIQEVQDVNLNNNVTVTIE